MQRIVDPASESVSESAKRRLDPKYQDGLLERGLVEHLYSRHGGQSERVDSELSRRLFAFGYSMASAAAELRREQDSLSTQVFVAAGQALETALSGNVSQPRTGFNAIVAALAYHLGHMNARAFVLMNRPLDLVNPELDVLRDLLLRRFSRLRGTVRAYLAVRADLPEDIREGSSEAIERKALCVNIHLAVGALMTYFVTGDPAHVARGVSRLEAGRVLSLKWGYTEEFVIADLMQLLFEDFRRRSYYAMLPEVPANKALSRLRSRFIEAIALGSPAQVDLWPSQTEAASRAFDPADDLVVSLPTSSGKTRVAELAMLPALAAKQRVVYVTPLRALSAQIERDLERLFGGLGYSVSAQYDSAPKQQVVEACDITVTTPEKLDFSIRRDAENALRNVGLIVLDEAHLIGTSARELRYEQLVNELRKYRGIERIRIVALSAMFGSRIGDIERFASWIGGDDSRPIVVEWKPTRRCFGTMSWDGDALALEFERPNETVSIDGFIRQERLPDRKRRNKTTLFPVSDDWQIVLATAFKSASGGKSVMIYNPLKASVRKGARDIVNYVKRGFLQPPAFDAEAFFTPAETAKIEEWLGSSHEVSHCLRLGIAIHHGDLPREVLSIVERMIDSRAAMIAVTSPSIAQGINIAASTIIFKSIYRWDPTSSSQKIIPLDEFTNVIGRAGRAFVDIEGEVILNLGMDGDPSGKDRNAWHELIAAADEGRLGSGLLRLVTDLLG